MYVSVSQAMSMKEAAALSSVSRLYFDVKLNKNEFFKHER
jgi:hypothetical protein